MDIYSFTETNSIEMVVCICINNAGCQFHVMREEMKKKQNRKQKWCHFSWPMKLCQTKQTTTQKKEAELKDSVWTTEVGTTKTLNNHHKKVNSTKYLNGFWIHKGFDQFTWYAWMCPIYRCRPPSIVPSLRGLVGDVCHMKSEMIVVIKYAAFINRRKRYRKHNRLLQTVSLWLRA